MTLTGPIEGEPGRAMEAPHEGAHARPVGVVQAMDARAVDFLDGRSRGDAVQLLVQVHHQEMQAVLPSALCGGEPRDLGMRDAVPLDAYQLETGEHILAR